MSNSVRLYGLQHARLPVFHCLLEFALTHVHWVGDIHTIYWNGKILKKKKWIVFCFPSWMRVELKKIDVYVYFLALVDLCCCMWAFCSYGAAVCCRVVVAPWAQTLDVWASVAAVHGLSSCGAWALWLLNIWNLPGLGIKLMSLALQGRFLATREALKLNF